MSEQNADSALVWQRCWCWQYGRCLVDCPTADLPKPVPMTDENWYQAYRRVMADRAQIDSSGTEPEGGGGS